MIDKGYLLDMQIVDERLSLLEEKYDKIIKLLIDITDDLSKIVVKSGDKTTGVKEDKYRCESVMLNSQNWR